MSENDTYAARWADAINETYQDWDTFETLLAPHFNEEDPDEFEKRVLTKAAECLRNGVPATFTGPELDLVRHLMPAHAVHQSGAVRWVLDVYGE